VEEAVMRGLRSFVVLLVVAVGLGAYIYFVDAKRTPGAASDREKVFEIESGEVTEMTIRTETGEVTSLRRADDGWRIVEPEELTADRTEASGLATSLSTLEVQRVVDEAPPSLAEYGLETPRVEVTFRTGETAEPRRLIIGDKTATGGDLYARTDASQRVFLIPAYLESTFNRSLFELRDKSVLKFDRDRADAIALVTGDRTVELRKADGQWRLTSPLQARGDYSTVEGLVGRLSTGQMKSIVDADDATLRTYGFDRPFVTARIGSGSAQATLQVGAETADGGRYARDTSRPLVFTVDSYLVDELTRDASEYRPKDVFEFRPFNATRLEVERNGATVVFEKQEGEPDDFRDRWAQTSPARETIDTAKLDDLLSALSNLRADSYVDGRGAGIDSPVATVRVRYQDDQKTEQVTLGRSADRALARRTDEPGAAVIDASSLDRIVELLDELEGPAAETE
jgi:hypothetical protein